MENQFFVLLIFMLSGFVIGALFDLFRVTRIIMKLPDFVTYIQDIVFWILAGSVLIFVVFYVNNDDIRLYQIVGLLFGVFFYFVLFSRFIFKIIFHLKTKVFCKNK